MTKHVSPAIEEYRTQEAIKTMLTALEMAFVALGKEGGNTIDGKYRGEWLMVRDAITVGEQVAK